MTQILIVEDNRNLAHGLRVNLEAEGYVVDLAYDGGAGLAQIRAQAPDLVILDLMLPGIDGYRVLRTIREEHYEGPVLILSAKSNEMDHVRGFRLGADDYVTKPFGLLELIARVDALLRRSRANGRAATTSDATPALDAVTFGAIRVEPATRLVYREGRQVALRPKEMDLLLALIRRGGAIATRDALLDEVWGYESEVITRTVDTHVLELRRKLEQNPAVPRHILTVRKAGYRLQF
jgi:two-component system, OmpR family, alkaline phosphatase synthesis response regulator PhoP